MPSNLLHACAYPLAEGREYLVFFGDDPSELPDDDVMAELSVASTIMKSPAHRGPGQDWLQSFGTNLLSEATWTGLLATLTATAAYVARRRKKSRALTNDLEVLSRLEAAAREALGIGPFDPATVDIEVGPDGTWQMAVAVEGGRVQAALDARGTTMHLTRTSRS